MMPYTVTDIRNLALIGPAASGKTSLVEALLSCAGVQNTPGSVDKGTSVCDYDALEQKYHHSINCAVVSFDHKGVHINLVDTPGLADFMGPTLSALAAVETVVLVLSAEAGIDAYSRRLMQAAREGNCCRMILIHKIDAEKADAAGLLDQVRTVFGKECLPLNLPAGGGTRVVDCFFNPTGSADFSSVAAAHRALVDQVVEVDEALMERYLEQGEIAPEDLHDPFEQALREGHIVPVCFAAARNGAGVDEFLRLIERLAPNPKEGNPHPFVARTGSGVESPWQPEPEPERHVLAHVFKVDFDPFVGKIGVLRVHQGALRKDAPLYVDAEKKPIKFGHLYKLYGKQLVEIEEGLPGDICAVSKVDEVHWDAIVHNSHDEDHVHLKPPWFPAAVAGLALQSKRRGDEQKVSEALARLAEEDPCLFVEHDATTHETILHGLGELHLKMALERLDQRFHVQVEAHPPRVPYRETITANGEGHYRHKKQSGGAGQFGEVFLRVEPLPRGAGFEFVDAITGGAIPGQFVPAVEKGVRLAIDAGVVAGYPLQDIRVAVYDGKYHSVDSNEVSFVIAGRRAFQEAVLYAQPIVLEPVFGLRVTAPERHMGDLSGDLAVRRARITGTEGAADGMLTITAEAPLAELANYSARLKSLTGGEGSYVLQLSHYAAVPAHIQQQLAAQHKAGAAAQE